MYTLRYANLGLDEAAVTSKGTFVLVSLLTNYLVIFPLSLKENLHEFRYISIIALLAIVYVAIILLVQLPAFYEHNYKPEIVVVANWEFITFIQGFSICVFAYNCQNHILPIYGELERLSTRRVYKVINRSVAIMCTIYFTIGMAGYWSTFNLTPRIVLERQSLSGDGIDTEILIGTIALIILLLIHSPVNYFPCRLIISQTVLEKDDFSRS